MSSHFWPWQYLGLIEEFLPRDGPRLQELLDIFSGPIGNSLKHYTSFTFSRRSRLLSDFICKSWKCCWWHSRNLSLYQMWSVVIFQGEYSSIVFKVKLLSGRWTFKIWLISLKNLYLTPFPGEPLFAVPAAFTHYRFNGSLLVFKHLKYLQPFSVPLYLLINWNTWEMFEQYFWGKYWQWFGVALYLLITISMELRVGCQTFLPSKPSLASSPALPRPATHTQQCNAGQ